MSHHDHEGNALKIGCAACFAAAERDQAHAAWKDAPVRRCTWSFTTHNFKQLSFTLDVRVPAGVEGWEVDEWYMERTGPEISDALARSGLVGDDASRAFFVACGTIRCTVGPIVPDDSKPPSDQLSLLDGAT